MKKGIYGAARRGSKRVKGISREVRVLNLNANYGIDQRVLDLLLVLTNPNRNPELFHKVYDSLLGLDAQMQEDVMEALAMYHNGKAVTFTCIEHVDRLLINLYKEIERVMES